MQVVENDFQGVPVLRVIGELDHASAPLLRASVDGAFAKGGTCILFDLASCPYVDSGGVSVLLDTLRRVKPEGWLGTVGATPDVLRILSLVGFTVDPSFRTFPTFAEAQTALEG